MEREEVEFFYILKEGRGTRQKAGGFEGREREREGSAIQSERGKKEA